LAAVLEVGGAEGVETCSGATDSAGKNRVVGAAGEVGGVGAQAHVGGIDAAGEIALVATGRPRRHHSAESAPQHRDGLFAREDLHGGNLAGRSIMIRKVGDHSGLVLICVRN
jgi:hypothetical protein